MNDFLSGPDFLIDCRFAFDEIDLPETCQRVPGMISPLEKKLLYRLARDFYSGAGSIIDAGTFLGASTASLASGLTSNADFERIAAKFRHGADPPIWGYDRGALQDTGSPEFEKNMRFDDTVVVLGESFEHILRRNLEPFGGLVELVLGEFTKIIWPSNKSIEICFVDIAKTQVLNRVACRNFFPRFIPEKTILIQQDFFFDRLPWIKVWMGALADCFEWLGQVGASSVYRCIKPISDAMGRTDYYRELPPETCIAAHKACNHEKLSRRRKFSLEISLAYLLGHKVGLEAANAHLDWVQDSYGDIIRMAVKGPMTAQGRIDRARRRLPEELKKLAKPVAR